MPKPIPSDAHCERCGMVATVSYVGPEGATHFVCEHHLPTEGIKPEKNDSKSEMHHGHSANMFRERFWISLIVTIPTVLYSTMFQGIIHWVPPAFPGSTWLPFLGGTFLFFYGGTVFLKSAISELKAKLPGMMTLISLAITTAYLWSVASMLLNLGSDFFWELATLVTIMLLGHWIEMSSVANAQGALHELSKLLPETAERIDAHGKSEPVMLANVRVGDVIRIRPGARIPTDGEVIEGNSSVNEAIISGESLPVTKTVKGAVIAGSVNGEGTLLVKTTRTGKDTALAGIMRLVAEAQASKSRTQVVADQAAFALTVIALVAGAATLIGWLIAGQSVTFAMERFVTVLVIACPHALGLAVPLVASISTTLAARNGLLIRQRTALETARTIDVVLFDKTGTLTTGLFGVVDVVAVPGKKIADVLAAAAAIEANSEHPLANAIVAKAKKLRIDIPTARGVSAIPGQGVQGKIGIRTITIGGPQLLVDRGINVIASLESVTEEAAKNGQTVVYVFDNNKMIGAITLADQIRPESREAILKLKQLGIESAMITGDSKAVATSVAKTLGIEIVFSQTLPKEKLEKVRTLQQQGKKVAMVGDGINDAAALTQADVGIAIGAGADVAIESAGIILVKNDPRDIVNVVTLARATYQKTVQNLVWATGYNVVAIPLAAGALAHYNFVLSPAVGAILMSCSTVIVAANAQLLRRIEL